MKSHLLLLLALGATIAVAIDNNGPTSQLISEKLQPAVPAGLDLRKHELQERTYESRLNHFDPRSSETVQFKYVQNVDYYKEGGPIYIFVSDGGDYTTEFLQIGLMHDIAHKTGAALVTSDNRFYRSNLPTVNASFENLQFLSVEQSISDVAHLIVEVKANLTGAEESKVILWGTGLGASLATWTKQKFPHLVNAVWSSSGVYRHLVHSADLYEQLSDTIETFGGDTCALHLYEAYTQMHVLISQRETARVVNSFNTCDDIIYHNGDEVASFILGVTQILIDYINRHHLPGIRNLCADISRHDPEIEDFPEFEAYAKWVKKVFTADYCLDASFKSRVNESSNIVWQDIASLNWQDTGVNVAYPVPSRPTLYWQCTQLGQFGTTVNVDTLFGHSIGQDLYLKFCRSIFGPEYRYEHLGRAVDDLYRQFGGTLPTIHDVIFTNGELDPALRSGIFKLHPDVNSGVLEIGNHGRSADLYSLSANDPFELQMAKEHISDLIIAWSK